MIGRIGWSALLAVSLTTPLSAQKSKPSQALHLPPELASARTALDKYRDPIVAIHDGYFSTLACIDFPAGGKTGEMAYPAGAMGVHFLNPSLVGPQLDSLKPQVLIYVPAGDSLQLVAAEWFAPTAVSPQAPSVWGHRLQGPMEGHHPIMPASMHHWDLHVWLWKNNPAGVFSPTNPALQCPAGRYTFHEESPKIVGEGG